MLKKYRVNGKQFIYEEGEQPEGAVEVRKMATPPNKTRKPANKARKAAKK